MNNKVIIITLIMIVIFTGCKNNKEFPENIKLGIVETTGETKDTSITFYNSELEECGDMDIKKGNVCSASSYAKIVENKVFMLPAGRTGKSDEEGIISLNIENGKIKEYDMGKNRMFDFIVDKDKIYGISATDTEKSTLIIYEISDGSTKYKEFKDITINRIFDDGNKIILCGFLYKSEHLQSKMIFLDKSDYSIDKDVDITSYGISVNDILHKNNGYYVAFSTQKSKDGMSEEMSDSIAYMENESIINIRTNEVISRIFDYNNEVYLMCYNKLNDEGNAIIRLDKDKKQRKVFVGDKIRQSYICDNNMYILGENKLCILDLDNNMGKQKEIQINHKLEQAGSYVSGFFVK